MNDTRSPRRILFAGYGKLAARLAPRLLERGDEVIALRRTDGPLPAGVDAIRADLSRPLAAPLPAVDAMLVTLPLGEVVAFLARALGVEVPPDDPSALPGGLVHDGALLRSLLGSLEYPTYQAGYAEMIAEASGPTRSLGA